LPEDQLENLRSALSTVYGEEMPPMLAAVLVAACGRGTVAFEDVQSIAGGAAGELLLFAWSQKLLLPRKFFRCSEWDDRVVGIVPGEIYEMPNISRYLVKSAMAGAKWDVRAAVGALYRDMGEAEWKKMPDVVDEICGHAVNGAISAPAIAAACTRAGVCGRTGALIAILKGGGIVSPKLRPLGPVIKAAVPLYEVNPCACPGSGGGR